MTSERGVWIYAVARDPDRSRLTAVTGVDEEPVRVVEHDGLAAIVGTVRLDEFGEDPLRRNLEDLDWLAPKARAHDAVVAAALDAGTAVPLPFATMYLDDARVHTLLVERASDFVAALNMLANRTEWGMKVYANPEATTTAPARPEGGQGGPGTAYLVRRRAALRAAEAAEREGAETAAEVHGALAAQAAAARRYPLHGPQLATGRGRMVLNGAYLVDDDHLGQFEDAISAFGETIAGYELELTGPWPPYSFSGVAEESR